MKKYIYGETEFERLPDPFMNTSPIDEETFVSLGGTITDDGNPSPKERVILSLNELLAQLAMQVQDISIADFKTAAQQLHSGELVDFARNAGVSDEIINSARIRIVEILADAMREGMTWNELIDGIFIPETE